MKHFISTTTTAITSKRLRSPACSVRSSLCVRGRSYFDFSSHLLWVCLFFLHLLFSTVQGQHGYQRWSYAGSPLPREIGKWQSYRQKAFVANRLTFYRLNKVRHHIIVAAAKVAVIETRVEAAVVVAIMIGSKWTVSSYKKYRLFNVLYQQLFSSLVSSSVAFTY